MDELFGRFFRAWPHRRLEEDSLGWVPPIDVIDRNEELVLRVDLPGMTERDIEVTVKNGMLTLRGTRHQESEEKDEQHYAMERWSGSFSRSLALPQGVKEEKIEASFRKGVLEIRFPKTKEALGRKIEVKAV